MAISSSPHYAGGDFLARQMVQIIVYFNIVQACLYKKNSTHHDTLREQVELLSSELNYNYFRYTALDTYTDTFSGKNYKLG